MGLPMNTIHSSSLIDPGAELGDDITIGPFCTVGAGVKLGDGCRLISHAVLDGDTEIEAGNVFYPFTIIGAAPQDLKFNNEKTGLFIGKNNVFRESVSVHRGTVTGIGETRVGSDNLIMGYVHIAHDCVIGNNNVLANYVGLSGHVTIDNHVILGGQTGVVQFLRIGSHSYVGGASVIDKNIPPFSSGYGNRIEIKSINIVGLKRAGFSRDRINAISDAHKLYFRSGLSEVEAIPRIEAELGDMEDVQLFLGFLHETGGKVH